MMDYVLKESKNATLKIKYIEGIAKRGYNYEDETVTESEYYEESQMNPSHRP